MTATQDTLRPTTKLQRAVVRQLGGIESLPDVARHGAAGGYGGFLYYADTVAFFRRNRKEILALAEETADSLGESLLPMLCGFQCFKGLSDLEIARGIDGRGDEATTVQNGLAWFALEEVARQLCPDV